MHSGRGSAGDHRVFMRDVRFCGRELRQHNSCFVRNEQKGREIEIDLKKSQDAAREYADGDP